MNAVKRTRGLAAYAFAALLFAGYLSDFRFFDRTSGSVENERIQ